MEVRRPTPAATFISCSTYGAAGDDFLEETASLNPVTAYGDSKVLVERDVAKLADDCFSPTFMTLVLPTAFTIGLWIVTGWIPRKPRRNVGIGPMIRFGGTVTLNGLIVYLAYNLEKALLGRSWGAEAVGIYGRSFQLISIPTDSLNSAAGEVAFPALSRVREDPGQFRN